MLAGEVLRQRREELNRSIVEVSEILKIRPEFITALENDLFDKLPVAVYARGYIRMYAEYLGLDPRPLMEVYAQHLSQPSPTAIMPISSSKKKSPFVFNLLIVLVIAAIFAGLVLLRSQHGSHETVSRETASAPAVRPAETVPAPAVESSAEQGQAVGSSPLPVSEGEAPRAAVAALSEHALRLEAVEITWLLVKFSDDRSEEVLLRPGETKAWTFTDSAAIKIGNAGGVKIQFDGKDLGTPGVSGQVVTLQFPPQR